MIVVSLKLSLMDCRFGIPTPGDANQMRRQHVSGSEFSSFGDAVQQQGFVVWVPGNLC